MMIRLRKSAFTPPRLSPLFPHTAWSCRTSKLLLLSCPTSADISGYGTPPCDMSRVAKRPDSSCAKEEAVGDESMGGLHGFKLAQIVAGTGLGCEASNVSGRVPWARTHSTVAETRCRALHDWSNSDPVALYPERKNYSQFLIQVQYR